MTDLVVMLDGDVVDQLVAYRPVFGLSKDRRGDGVWLTGWAYHALLVPQPATGKMIVMGDEDALRQDPGFAWGELILSRMKTTMRNLLRRRR